jgi:hypothetical protein
MKSIYPIDPKTKKRSVTLLLVMVASLAVLSNIALAALGYVKEELPMVREFFFGALGAYTARKFTFSKDSVDIEESSKE